MGFGVEELKEMERRGELTSMETVEELKGKVKELCEEITRRELEELRRLYNEIDAICVENVVKQRLGTIKNSDKIMFKRLTEELETQADERAQEIYLYGNEYDEWKAGNTIANMNRSLEMARAKIFGVWKG